MDDTCSTVSTSSDLGHFRLLSTLAASAVLGDAQLAISEPDCGGLLRGILLQEAFHGRLACASVGAGGRLQGQGVFMVGTRATCRRLGLGEVEVEVVVGSSILCQVSDSIQEHHRCYTPLR